MDQEKVEIIVNKEFWTKVPQKAVLGNIFGLFLSEIECMSDDALKNLVASAMELVRGLEKPNITLSRTVRYAESLVRFFDRESIMTFIVNTFLTTEKMGLMHGFGLANYEKSEEGRMKIKGHIPIDPERTPINFI